MNLEKLIEDVELLNEDKQYTIVDSILTEEILIGHKNIDLYLEKGEALWCLRKFEECEVVISQALSIDSKSVLALAYRANLYWQKKEYDKAIDHYLEVLDNDPEYSYAYRGLGLCYTSLGRYQEAEHYFKRAIAIKPDYRLAYESLGNTYKLLGQYEKAIETYKKAIEIKSEKSNSYFALGNIYAEMERYQEAIDAYTEQMKISPENVRLLYNRGIVYEKYGKYTNALEDLEQFLNLSPNDNGYQKFHAESRIKELHNLVAISHYNEIATLVRNIKKLLLYNEACVTHYTSLSVAELLILKKSLLRLSEGAFLNDTSEGKELYKHLPSLDTSFINPEADTIAQPFTQKPFIGSYVAESKHDDLTMWRMYGKENMIEAKGCAITLDRIGFLQAILKNLDSEDNSVVKTEEDNITKTNESAGIVNKDEFNFYRVAYRNREKKFEIPGARAKNEKELNKHMVDLCKTIDKFNLNLKKSISDVQNVKELLNEIAFLFKSGEYQYEHEIRLVLKGTGFEKNIISKKESITLSPPRVYIELVEINSLIKQITLGPKVENAEEWAASFYYSLESSKYSPEILISHLPFK